MINNLLYLSPTRNLLYVTDVYMIPDAGATPSRRFEHLSCFLPGLLALGAHTLPEHAMPPHVRELHMWAASGLAYSCWLMYADQPTGLGPEEVTFLSAYEVEAARVAAAAAEEAARPVTTTEEAAPLTTTEGVENMEVGAGGPGPGSHRTTRPVMRVNQTEWDEHLRWSNALTQWRESGAAGTPPGLALAPPVPVGSPARDYRANNQAFLLRPEVSPARALRM